MRTCHEEGAMKKHLPLFVIYVLFITVSISSNGVAATIRANSCSLSDVQSAVNSAKTGDQVLVPAGNCTWSNTLSVRSGTKILLQGAGIDSTVIHKSPDGTVIDLGSSGTRVTGFTLNGGHVLVDGDGWRIDHCRFYRATNAAEGVFARGQRDALHPTGLVDHCTFHNSRVLVFGDAGLLAHALWAQPLNLGSGTGVVYVEDCVFTATEFHNAIDTNYGGRYVFRYNTLTDIYIEAHSLQGNHRATRKWEIYKNTFHQVNRSMWVPMMLRGGTGVVFDNILTGTWGQPGISLDNVRSCQTYSVSGKCDGSSPWDGNVANGYPCRDQIGRSTDAYLWTAGKPYPPQALDPAYSWNNKHGSRDFNFFQHSCAESAAHIQPGRDYFNNVARPEYVPYTYPHPLTQGWNPALLAPPQNLRIDDVIE